jgi:hypothetical protein
MPNAMNHVVLSASEYEHQKNELLRLLEEGFTSMREGKGHPADEIFLELDKEFGYDVQGNP